MQEEEDDKEKNQDSMRFYDVGIAADFRFSVKGGGAGLPGDEPGGTMDG